MDNSQIYILVSIFALAVIALLVFLASKSRKEKKLTPLASLAFGFVVAGILFGDDRLISHSLMGIGVLLAVVDIFRQRKKAI